MGFRVLIYILLAEYYVNVSLALECNVYQSGDLAVSTTTCQTTEQCEIIIKESHNNTWMYHSLRCNVCEKRNFTSFGVEYRADCCNTSLCGNKLFESLEPIFPFKRVDATSTTTNSTRLHTSTEVHQPTHRSTTILSIEHSLPSQTAIASTTPSSSSDNSNRENSIETITVVIAALLFVIIIIVFFILILLALCMYLKNNKFNNPTQRQDSPPVGLQQIVLPSRSNPVVPPTNYSFPIQETSL